MWLAGHFIAEGQPDLVYASSSQIFTMLPPSDDWLRAAAEIGHESQVFPYLYPPLWAALIAPVTRWLSFGAFEAGITAANGVFLFATSWLAWRALRSPMPAIAFALLGQILLYGTTIGGLAVLQNQPQIFVAFLTVLAIERGRAGAQITAGSALALAAAIKLLPLIFLPIFMARGQWRAAAAFIVVGASLAGTSIALTGWPLHMDFLASVQAIGATIIRLSPAVGFENAIASLLPESALTTIRAASLDPTFGGAWFVMERPAVWMLASRTATLATLAVLVFWAHRTPEDELYSRVWPTALILLLLLQPLSWCYYFIAPLVFAPAILTSYGGRLGLTILMVITLPVSMFVLRLYRSFIGPLDAEVISALGLLSVICLLAAMSLAPRRGDRTKQEPRQAARVDGKVREQTGEALPRADATSLRAGRIKPPMLSSPHHVA
ncbi:glycosyltransferase family 87 protein [Tropicimonas isoalkanivorans]|uniref:Alpha-1,2-mannosyltransferase n=1 Tax=Tropicimonas isoalkanivorans TaxID=441112 RepID=A0A1I1PHW0_9RHOB|nr:glycosyltransferase family 87 protein [Tropicimonas isoalkanivorans]SFD09266.1 Protein of unknown function [Tropicimonas isoalkanivorans]